MGKKPTAKKRRKATTHSLVSKSKLGIVLKPKTFQFLSQKAKDARLSKSELLEEIVRDSKAIALDPANDRIIGNTLIEKINRNESVQNALKDESREAINVNSKLEIEVAKSESYEELEQQLSFQKAEIASLQKQLEGQNIQAEQQAAARQTLEYELESRTRQINELEQQAEQQAAARQTLEHELESRTRQINELGQQAEQQAAARQALEHELESKTRQINELGQQAEQQAAARQALEHELESKTRQISELESQLQVQRDRAFEQQIQEQANLIHDLKLQLVQQFWNWMRIAFLCALLPASLALLMR